jgi:hypothetical protein
MTACYLCYDIMEGWDRCGDQGREVIIEHAFRLYDTLMDQRNGSV